MFFLDLLAALLALHLEKLFLSLVSVVLLLDEVVVAVDNHIL